MASDRFIVRKCVCFDVTFHELKEAGVESMQEIVERYRCGTKCGACVPYLRRMLETGDTVFDLIWDDGT